MNIKVTFLNGSQYWRDKVTVNAAIVSSVLSDERFLATVEATTLFDYTADSPFHIADKIRTAGTVSITVGFYWNWFSRAIAYEVEEGVKFNTAKEFYGSGGCGNVAHETMHAAPFYYQHNGNSPGGNQQTVPYAIGNMVQAWLVNNPVTEPA